MTCKYPTCTNDVGQQDRDDYKHRTFCSIQCQTKLEHIKMDARDAQESVKEEADTKEAYF
jgi:endogenous inhibitor of DNA gyrase (YacG/DUF329 family)